MQKPIKILMLNQTFYPDSVATAQHTLDLALFLTERGCKVSVVCGKRGYDDRSKQHPAHEVFKGIDIHRLGSTGFGKLTFFRRIVDAVTFDLSLAWKLLFFPKQDLVVCFTSPPLIGLFGMFFCWLKGGDLAQWLMDINPEAAIAVGYLKSRSFSARLFLGVFRMTLKRSHLLIVLDRWMKEKVVAHGISPDRVTIIPPWPIQDQQNNLGLLEKSSNPLRAKYGLENKFVILYSGNHSIVHPPDTLLQAAKAMKDDERFKFVFIGNGFRVQEVTQFAKENDLKNVLQLPHQPRELLKFSLGLADLHVVIMGEAVAGLVHTSKIYGVLATGVPAVVIAPKSSHLVDLLDLCPFGYHVEHRDCEGLVKIIGAAAKLTDADRKAYYLRNTEYVRTNYSLHLALTPLVERLMETEESPSVARSVSNFS
jgi:colanic acid biosynthesis glycosyl transferase WcaI